MFWTVMTIPKNLYKIVNHDTIIKKNICSNKIKAFLNKEIEHNLYDFKYFKNISKQYKKKIVIN